MKQTTTNRYADIIAAYNADPASEKALTDLATATVFAVLKKVIGASQNPMLVTIRKELSRDRADLARLDYSTNNATRITFNADGDAVPEVLDQSLVDESARLAGLPLGDGLDLVHDAIVSILEQTAAQMERDPDQPTDMERRYSVRRLKRKVYIQTAESVNGWETVETSPIQEVYKAVRRSIDASRAAQTDPRNGYTYLEDVATDGESGESSTIYRRLPKYTDMGGRVCDFNGKETVATSAAAADVEELDRLVAALNLSDQQAAVLKYRLCGYGYKAIATRLGVRAANIQTQVKRIQDKAVAIGIIVK